MTTPTQPNNSPPKQSLPQVDSPIYSAFVALSSFPASILLTFCLNLERYIDCGMGAYLAQEWVQEIIISFKGVFAIGATSSFVNQFEGRKFGPLISEYVKLS